MDIMETRMSKYEWRRISDDCIAFNIRDIMHYNVEFDQHENILSIDFEGGPSMSMDELVVVDGSVFRVTGVRDIVKMNMEFDHNYWHYPFDMEVRFDAVKVL